MTIAERLSGRGQGQNPWGPPTGWHELALAAAGDPEWTEWAARLGRGARGADAVLEAAAVVVHARPDWPAAAEFAADNETALGQWRTISLGLPEDIPYRFALMDTTTLFTALALTDARNARLANPLSLLDLITFLNTACLVDRICYLENRHFGLADLRRRFGEDLFVELPVASTAEPNSDFGALGDIRPALHTLYKTRTVSWMNDVRAGNLGTCPQRAAWVKSWTSILRCPCAADWLLRDPDEGHSEKYSDVWETPVEDIVDEIARVMTDQLRYADEGLVGPERSGRVRLAQESNARALSNSHIAGVLRVPYAASTARLPIMRLLIDSTRITLADLRAIPRAARALQDAYGDAYGELIDEPDELPLPFFASVILHTAGKPSELPDTLASVRGRTEKLRERLRELEPHFRSGDRIALEAKQELRAAFKKESSRASVHEIAEFSAASGHCALVMMDPQQFYLSIVVALLYGIVGASTARQVLRSAQPVYRVVHRLDPAVDSAPDVQRLWGIPDADDWARRMNELVKIAPT